jgi:hypothetical protein
MAFDPGLLVYNCADLVPGDEIQAWQDGRLFHMGTVTEVLPGMSLFWIHEYPLGERRLLDMTELDVIRTPLTAPDGPGPAVA